MLKKILAILLSVFSMVILWRFTTKGEWDLAPFLSAVIILELTVPLICNLIIEQKKAATTISLIITPIVVGFAAALSTNEPMWPIALIIILIITSPVWIGNSLYAKHLINKLNIFEKI